MRFKLTIALVVLNLALAALIYMTQSRQADEDLRRHSRMVFPSGLGDLDEIDVRAAAGDGWTLQRRRDGWHLGRPMEWPANTHAVSRLVTTLEFLEKESVFSLAEAAAAGRDLADYGLESPFLEVRLHRGTGETLLQLGRPALAANRLYLRVDGRDELAVLGPELILAMGVELDQLRAEEIFGLPHFDVRSIHLQITDLGNLRVRLERSGEDWSFVAPIQAPADRSRVAATLRALLAMRVESFVDVSGAVSGLDNPSMRLTLEAGSRRQTLLIGGAAGSAERPAFYARREDSATVFTVAAAAVEELRAAQESLRDKAFVKVSRDRLTGLRLIAGERPVVLKRLEDGQGWQVIQHGPSGPVPRAADSVLVGRLVESLVDLEAVAFVSDAPSQSDLDRYGLTQPSWRVQLEAAETRELQIGEAVPGRPTLYARMANEPFVYEIPATFLGRLRTRALDYRRRVIEELPAAAEIRELSLIRRSDDQVVFAGAPDEVAEGAPDEARREAVAALVAAVRAFAVESFLEEQVDEAGVDLGTRVEPWLWELRAQVDLPGGTGQAQRTVRYWMTERLGGVTQFGAAPDAGLTFTVPAAVVDALFAWTYDRPPPELPAAVLERDPEAAQRGGRTGTGAGLPEGPPIIPERTEPAPDPAAPEPPQPPPAEPTPEPVPVAPPADGANPAT